MDRIGLVMNRRSRASHVVDPIILPGSRKRLRNILDVKVADLSGKINIFPSSRMKVVEDIHLVTHRDKRFNQVGTDKSGTSRNKYFHWLLSVSAGIPSGKTGVERPGNNPDSVAVTEKEWASTPSLQTDAKTLA
jgi:hypothetical protein